MDRFAPDPVNCHDSVAPVAVCGWMEMYSSDMVIPDGHASIQLALPIDSAETGITGKAPMQIRTASSRDNSRCRVLVVMCITHPFLSLCLRNTKWPLHFKNTEANPGLYEQPEG